VTFDGEGGDLDFAAGVVANGRDHVDTTVVVEHMAPGCRSRELFKAVLDGQARAVSQGKVVVDRLAQKTDGKQMAQALMLSEDAEFDSKPELEIYADDVACGHGSTSARIDPEHIFYLRSRGIPQADAEALLTEAFIAEVFDAIDDESIREVVVQLARDWLAANASQ
jgi:Fe-S cluster assembly protein SufD